MPWKNIAFDSLCFVLFSGFVRFCQGINVLAGKHVRSIVEVLRLNIHGNYKKIGNYTSLLHLGFDKFSNFKIFQFEFINF